ncbi:MAG: hypothetical protein EP338_09420 [Bacteroidetes bacterium]|nr:MAG: hypothetical protein EP338_09420 [Bacteroidota bacterium]
MIRLIPFISLLLVLFACQQPESNRKKKLVPQKIPAPKAQIVPQRPDSLSIYFKNPIDFYALKKQTRMLNSGWFHVGKRFFRAKDSNEVYFDYWAYEFDTKDPKRHRDRALTFRTIKPFSSPRERYYETDNETLVGIKSRVVYPALGPSNFVGLQKEQILRRFGPPMIERGNYIGYFRGEQLLLFQLNEERIQWFKYFYLRDPVKEPTQIPKIFYKW